VRFLVKDRIGLANDYVMETDRISGDGIAPDWDAYCWRAYCVYGRGDRS
jgi:hypothetical protein